MKIYAAADIAHRSEQIATRQIMYCSSKVGRAWFVGGWQLSHPGPPNEQYQPAADVIWQNWSKFWSGTADLDAVKHAIGVLNGCFVAGGDDRVIENLPVWWALGTGYLIIGEDGNYHFDMATSAMRPLVERAVAKAMAANCDMIVFDNEAPGFFQNINLGMEYQRRTVRRHKWQNAHAREVCQTIPISHWMTLSGLTGNQLNPADPVEVEFLAESAKARQINDYSVSGIYGSIDQVKAEHARMASHCKTLKIDFVPSIEVNDGVTAEWMAERLAFFSPRVSRCILWAPGVSVIDPDVFSVVRRYAK